MGLAIVSDGVSGYLDGLKQMLMRECLCESKVD
jgi:hypothetical protein